MTPDCDRPTIKEFLGDEVLERLWRAKEQEGRREGWLEAADLVVRAFGESKLVQVPQKDQPVSLTTFAWSADPVKFLCNLEEILGQLQIRFVNVGKTGFSMPSGAVACCISSVKAVRRKICKHEWGEDRSAGGYDEPPYSFHACKLCGMEKEIE